MKTQSRGHRAFKPVSGRGSAVLLLLVLAALSVAPAARQRQEEGGAVTVGRLPSGGGVSLIVQNHRAHDVTLTLTIHTDNGQVTRVRPETETYPPYSRLEAARVKGTAARGRWNYRFRLEWVKGSMHARHDDDVVYRLPFAKGTSCRVTQGYDGRLTHTGHNRYAVDFAMREGTSVCAARPGVVVDLKESSDTGGPQRKYRDESNYVSIAHDDGTIGEYHHLKHEGVLVEIGQKVEVGQKIALSGNTGYSTLPHLHFGVYSAVDGKHLQSYPVTFVSRRGLVTHPRQGRVYTAK
jgi:murein DD-endopeptidase MepM/ murein hydrolase activator NlpD